MSAGPTPLADVVTGPPVAMVAGGPTVLVGALAGALLAIAAREAVLASPAAAAWLRQALEPLRRAGREGWSPAHYPAAANPRPDVVTA